MHKEKERDRVTHLKTQTHLHTKTGPVELELMWPEAAQCPVTHTHTHCIHFRAICSCRYSLQKGFTAGILRLTEGEKDKKRREK